MSGEIVSECVTGSLVDLISQLTPDQIAFVVARQDFRTDKEAAEHIKISPRTVQSWKSKDIPIDEAVQLMAADGLIVAQHIRRRNLAKAMQVKVGGLDSGDERLKQGVATEIIEWEMGKAAQPFAGEVGLNVAVDARGELISRLSDIVARKEAASVSGDAE